MLLLVLVFFSQSDSQLKNIILCCLIKWGSVVCTWLLLSVCGVDGYIRSIYLLDCNFGGISFFLFFALSCLLSHARLELQMIQVSVTWLSYFSQPCYLTVLLQSALLVLHDCLTSVAPVIGSLCVPSVQNPNRSWYKQVHLWYLCIIYSLSLFLLKLVIDEDIIMMVFDIKVTISDFLTDLFQLVVLFLQHGGQSIASACFNVKWWNHLSFNSSK